MNQCLPNTEDNTQIWIVGAIDTQTRKTRYDNINIRDANNLRIFFTNHIYHGNHITHDGWLGYNFLNEEDSPWTHEVHNHGHGDFGFGENSTSHIEQCWAHLKKFIKTIYGYIPSKNFIYYFREAEFRIILSKKENNLIKENLFQKVFKYVYIDCQYIFKSEEEISDFTNYE